MSVVSGRYERKPTDRPYVGRRRRSNADGLAEPAVWFAGRWRSPQGVEAVRQRYRLRERARHATARRRASKGD